MEQNIKRSFWTETMLIQITGYVLEVNSLWKLSATTAQPHEIWVIFPPSAEHQEQKKQNKNKAFFNKNKKLALLFFLPIFRSLIRLYQSWKYRFFTFLNSKQYHNKIIYYWGLLHYTFVYHKTWLIFVRSNYGI